MKRKEKSLSKKGTVPGPDAFSTHWRWLPTFAVLASFLYIIGGFYVPRDPSGFDLKGFGQLPVLNGGRLKPVDTLARSSLLTLSGKQTASFNGTRYTATHWLLEMVARPIIADEWPVIRIDDPDVLGMMGIEQTGKRLFSFSELHPYLTLIFQQASRASEAPAEDRNRFQSSLLTLHSQLNLYDQLQNSVDRVGRENSLKHLNEELGEVVGLMKNHARLLQSSSNSPDVKRLSEFLNEYSALDQAAAFYPFPSLLRRKSDSDWVSAGQAMLQSVAGSGLHPGLADVAAMMDSYRAEDVFVFNRKLSDYRSWLDGEVPSVLSHVQKEFYFNYAEPFYKALVLYFLVFVLVLIFWLTGRPVYQQTAFALLAFTFFIHTAGLVARMVLHGRPPVTNLYSSAIFVGWVAVLLGLVLERLSRKGFGILVSSLIGFTTLIIAHNLAAQGDTLEMMRAVLDSNFWLSTHVVCITTGYGSTFLAGALGIVYILRRRLDPHWTDEAGAALERMAYGVVCFSLFFSFVGTILGGIWADQSWGRFWGWDPKENGALMIVLWNSFILHARWGKMASERGLMAMTVVGNIVTSLSWFGVNMLGIGLHSYGFMDKAFFWLVVFIITQLVLIASAYFPVSLKSKEG